MVFPVAVTFPLEKYMQWGETTSRFWDYSALERVSIYEPKVGNVTALDIKIDGESFVLNDFENLNELAATFQKVTSEKLGSVRINDPKKKLK
jgi:hypothetical protein